MKTDEKISHSGLAELCCQQNGQEMEKVKNEIPDLKHLLCFSACMLTLCIAVGTTAELMM